jgi:predicted phosphodiesterase
MDCLAQSKPVAKPLEAEWESWIPRPITGTLLAGPWILGTTPDRLVLRWEVMGETEGKIVLRGQDGTERTLEGTLLSADLLTIHLPGRVYEAEPGALTPCADQEYRLEPFEKKGFPHRFRTPPRPGELCPEPLRIVAYGDSRTNHKIHASLMPTFGKANPQLLVNIGDIVHTARRVFEWQKFFEIEKRLLADAPIAIVPGNHEAYKDSAFGAAMFDRYFLHPSGGSGHHVADFGPVRFFLLDQYWGPALDAEGLRWLEDQLDATPGDRYRIVVMHEPVYSFAYHRPSEALRALRPVFKRHGVTAVLAGHAHLYEHFLADGIHYLTLGGAGAPFHEPFQNLVPEERHLLVRTDKVYHFLLMEVDEKGIRFRTINAKTGKTIEEWSVPGMAQEEPHCVG